MYNMLKIQNADVPKIFNKSRQKLASTKKKNFFNKSKL